MDEEKIRELIRQETAKSAPQPRTFYFMAGLPRSGSTLLSAILNQNPRFYSGPSSPVVPTMLALENSLANDELFMAYPKPEIARMIIANVLPQFYADVEQPVIFDKNRSWVNRMHYIPGYFGIEPKILIPVRNVDEILTSFITMCRRNPYTGEGKINFIDENLIKLNLPLTDDARCELLVSPNGILGQSFNGIRQAIMEGRQSQLHFIEYDDLTNNPEETMRKVYEFLGEPYFEHDFTNLVNVHQERDAEVYGLADMHLVRKELGKVSADPREVLSEETLARCEGSEFWRNLGEYNPEEEYIETEDDSSEDSETSLIGG